MLSTAGNLLIQGTISKTLAIYRADTGAKLWEMNIDQARDPGRDHLPVVSAFGRLQVGCSGLDSGCPAPDALAFPNVKCGARPRDAAAACGLPTTAICPVPTTPASSRSESGNAEQHDEEGAGNG